LPINRSALGRKIGNCKVHSIAVPDDFKKSKAMRIAKMMLSVAPGPTISVAELAGNKFNEEE